jgi:hypothetical protein
MPNYKNSKIYKIVDNTSDMIYIGSTTKKLCERLASHISNYKRYLNDKRRNSITSFKILANGNYDIVLIENFPCNTKEELYVRERHYIETLNCINKHKPGLLIELGRHEYGKQYREKNNDLIKVYVQQYYKNHSEDKKKYRDQYCIDHKDELCEKHECDCGGTFSYKHKARHIKTNKHQNFLQNQ